MESMALTVSPQVLALVRLGNCLTFVQSLAMRRRRWTTRCHDFDDKRIVSLGLGKGPSVGIGRPAPPLSVDELVRKDAHGPRTTSCVTRG